jgi:outer membrane protein OmpA-like peptidoglycan-associated protein
LGIKLNELNLNANVKKNVCNSESEVRIFRILFLLPFKESQISESKLGEKDSIQSIKEYAKPWDIGFTIFGFLFSLNSSTIFYQYCTEAEIKTFSTSTEKPGIALPYYKSANASKPAEQLLFAKDDHNLSESEKSKVLQLAQSVRKTEEKFQVILVGKTNSSGDIAYQTRLTRRRAEEIKSVLMTESIDGERIHIVFTDKDFGGSESVSTIAIFLVKE